MAAWFAQLYALLLAGNPQMRYAGTGVNGAVALEPSAAKLAATYYELDAGGAATSYYERPWKLMGKLGAERIEVAAAGVAGAGVPAAA